MASELLQVADAVVTALNIGGLISPITAVRSYVPQYELQDMGVMHVTVVPSGMIQVREVKTMCVYDYAIDIAVQKRPKTIEPADMDALTDLTQAIAESFRLKRLDAFPTAAWLSTAYTAIFDPDHLARFRQFTGVFTLNFRVVR